MIDITVLDNFIAAVGHNTFIDEVLARLPEEQVKAILNEIAENQGLDVVI